MDTTNQHLKEMGILPEIGFVRLPQILAVLPMGKSTFWNRVKAGIYPKPKKLGAKISVWRVEDIRKILADPENYQAE
jgi:prophage regulatory protein